MVAKFLDDNKPKHHLKSEFALFQPSAVLFSFIRNPLICKMLAKFSRVESERTVFKFRKRLRNFLCCVYLNSIKQVSEIWKFHVEVVKLYKKK